MGMGYDYDDPRDQDVRDRLRSGYYGKGKATQPTRPAGPRSVTLPGRAK